MRRNASRVTWCPWRECAGSRSDRQAATGCGGQWGSALGDGSHTLGDKCIRVGDADRALVRRAEATRFRGLLNIL